ncbi:phosphonate metabolism transcriptional regulator PhnF [Pseudotabrizicola algicola]|uniref:Phosphonate metabolism transcriptional regulator PhnF n=1 Tax=Pseudotabrizicola algicola TaxID=2709381 RepID=A0A6B3RTC1_9RHOB|nr:phosphonate metabolism transcriptional regulator PhnF [Pseudotabrizicola algicola]NEX48771.1 phosphonate metabolism transcriptional regulator PhnF [Pseudotabrizicola algicola]
MPREALWSAIAATLRAEIADGAYAPGARLPTEAELSARFGVNRHTLRRALADLAQAGVIVSRRGSGVFVAARPTDYRLGRRVRFHQTVSDSGRTPSRRITRLETRPAQSVEATALEIAPGALVHVVEGVSLADGMPLGAFRSVFAAARFPELLTAMEGQSSVTAALRSCGLMDYTRRDTRLTAKLADPVLALALQVKPGAPVLRSVALNIDAAGVPVEFGTTWFAGDRVTLTVSPDQP